MAVKFKKCVTLSHIYNIAYIYTIYSIVVKFQTCFVGIQMNYIIWLKSLFYLNSNKLTPFALNAYTHCILNTKLGCIYKSERTSMFNAQVSIETN